MASNSMSPDPLPILASLALGASLIYAACHLLVLLGLFRRRPPTLAPAAKVSVIIAARNEAERIGVLLTSLARQTRLPDDIVVVDDRSDDGTAQEVERFTGRFPSLRVVRVEHLPTGAAPKKHALQQGIAASTGEILCFTDADVVVPPAWLQTIAALMSPSVGVVVGFYVPAPSMTPATLAEAFLHRFTAYEKFKTAILSAGSIGWGFAWTASGSNLAYRRSVFEEVGGFSGQHASISGDDDLFVQRVRRQTTWKIVAMTEPEATVTTEIPTSLKGFLRQRIRHLSAGRWYDARSSVALAIYHASNVLATASLFGAVMAPGSGLLNAYVVKLCADLVLCVAGDLRLHRPRAWTWFIPLELVNVLYTMIVGAVSRWAKVSWKGTPDRP